MKKGGVLISTISLPSKETAATYGVRGEILFVQPNSRQLSEIAQLIDAGPGYLVSVGYIDPGNWATDIAGGSKFGYTLLTVILLSNLMAILLQSLCVRLGVATGRDLAQACRDYFSQRVSFCLWVLCEIAIAACDLAELLASAIALQLLFSIPLVWGVCVSLRWMSWYCYFCNIKAFAIQKPW